jgi:hypothetical protein
MYDHMRHRIFRVSKACLVCTICDLFFNSLPVPNKDYLCFRKSKIFNMLNTMKYQELINIIT